MATAAKKQRLSPDQIWHERPAIHPDHLSAGTMWKQRCDELKAFLVALRERQVDEFVSSDDELFCTIIDLSTSEYGIEQKRIAEHLGVSPTAITRWKHREHAPRPYARKGVILAISALVEEKITELERK